MTSRKTAAHKLDVDLHTINTLCGQLADDPDLYNADTDTITDAGLEILADQINATNPAGDDMLIDIEDATAARNEANERWQAAIFAAFACGRRRTKIAEAASISRERVYQIINERR